MSFINVFKKEVRWNLKAFLIWTAIFVAFALMYIPITDQMLQRSDDIIKLLDMMPKFIRQMFNLEEELLTRPEGIFGSEGMSFVYILSAVFSSMLAGSLFAKEFEQKTIEYLIVKPGSRVTVFLSKSLVMILYLVALSAVFVFSITRLFDIFVNASYNQTILLGFGLYALSVQMFFAGVATIVAVIGQKSSLNISVSIGLVIFMYFGDTLSNSFEVISWVGKFSVFHYIPLVQTIVEERVVVGNSILIMLLSLGLLAIGMLIFRKVDVKV